MSWSCISFIMHVHTGEQTYCQKWHLDKMRQGKLGHVVLRELVANKIKYLQNNKWSEWSI
jgi:hypothetical protein